MTKNQVFATLQELPDTFEPEQLIERLLSLQRMEEGLDQVRRGEVLTVEEAKSRLNKWLA